MVRNTKTENSTTMKKLINAKKESNLSIERALREKRRTRSFPQKGGKVHIKAERGARVYLIKEN